MEYLDITVNKEGYIEFESDKAKIVFSTAETGKNFNRHTEDGVKTLNAIIEEFQVEEVAYIRQVHSSTIHVLSNDDIKNFIEKEGDAIITSKTNTAIGVFTADCVPVIIVDDAKGVVAAIHSGWRGTISSITKKTIEAMNREYNTELWGISRIKRNFFRRDKDTRRGFIWWKKIISRGMYIKRYKRNWCFRGKYIYIKFMYLLQWRYKATFV